MTPMPRRAQLSSRLRVAGIETMVTYKHIKTIRVRVLPPDGRVAVSAPVGVPEDAVEDFVRRHSAWIVEAQARVRMAAPVAEPLVDGGRARVWGRWYELRTVPAVKAGGTLEAGTVLLGGPDEEARRRGLEGLYRREIEAALPALQAEWEPRVGRSASLIRLRRMTSRWGTCNTRSAAITINVALAEHPPSALEYVLVHELVHLHERGHGPGFVAWMDRLLPDWRVRRRSLHGRA